MKCKSCNHNKKDHFVWAHCKGKELINCKGRGFQQILLSPRLGFSTVSVCKCCGFEGNKK